MEQVQKDVEKLLPAIQRQEMQAMAKERIRGEKQFLIETHAERVNATVWNLPLFLLGFSFKPVPR
jgi:uncharacterized protein (UPF0276 family)